MPDRRINAYRRAALEMAKGHFDLEIPLEPGGELGQLGHALLNLGRKLEGRFSEISALNAVTALANSGIVIDEILNCLYDSFRPIIPYDRIGFALLEEEGKILRARWCRSESAQLVLGKGYSAPMQGSSLADIIKTGKPRIINDLMDHLKRNPKSTSTEKILAEGIRSSLTCPLIAMGKPLGFIFFSSMQTNSYESVHVDLFMQIAGQLAVILEKSRLYEKVEQTNRQLLQEIEVRKQVENALRESEARLKMANERLLELANRDGLTGVANRRVYEETIPSEWRRAIRNHYVLSVVLLDVDFFKLYNDTYGHLAGDDCLKLVAAALSDCVKRPGDLVARYGGEEFVLLLPQTDETGARAIAETICRQIEGLKIPHETSSVADHITVSVGTATWTPQQGDNWDQFVQLADDALYHAKKNGRNRVEQARNIEREMNLKPTGNKPPRP